MARPLRLNIADGWYHVFHRGTERCRIFADDRDRAHFLELLAEMHARYRIRIHGYVLMDSHYHDLLQTPDANLSEAMQWLHTSYAAWFNTRHQRVGPLWQGRFGAVPVENSAWAYELSLYIHLNPVKAGLVTRPDEWPYSNYLEWVERRGGTLVDRVFVRGYFPAAADYERFVMSEIEPLLEQGLEMIYLE